MENNQLKCGDYIHFTIGARADDDDHQINYRRLRAIMSAVMSHILKFVDLSKT